MNPSENPRKKGSRIFLTAEERKIKHQQILAGHKSGMNRSELAKKYEVSVSYVDYVKRMAREPGVAKPKNLPIVHETVTVRDVPFPPGLMGGGISISGSPEDVGRMLRAMTGAGYVH